MKNLKNKLKTKNPKRIHAIISIFVLLPLSFLIYSLKAGDDCAYHFKTDVSTNKCAPPDSSLIKLQSAIDLATANPDETNYINLSLEYFQNTMYNECVWAAQKALEYNVNSYIAYNNMCSAYNQLGMWDEAIAAGKNAIAVIPGAQLASNNLQLSFDGKAKLDKDIADAEVLVKTLPSEENYLNLGYLYYQANNFELSISTNQKAIEINKKSVIAYNNICSAYNEMGKWADAVVYCEKALAVDSGYTLSKNNLQVAKGNIKK
ncbi:MAG: tetratricopeptide repeat protein [Bacteroidota bacterium]